ncbi:MAG TPA: hypothetical protein DG048_02960 [Pseudoalteromonas sp.]|nr:hypothetical protein [Pseudoalteromonas sp.]|tara:strand:- start:12669 stop:13028 length:360 start_codon:yes stop_codon:yes gene_type:complete
MKKFLLFVFLIIPTLTNASETEELKRLVISLNQHVVNLEKRVAELEQQIKSKPTNITIEKAAWRKLKRGMSFSQVRAILGEPKKIVAGYATYWYYSSQLYSSRVSFNNYEKVSGWDEPN